MISRSRLARRDRRCARRNESRTIVRGAAHEQRVGDVEVGPARRQRLARRPLPREQDEVAHGVDRLAACCADSGTETSPNSAPAVRRGRRDCPARPPMMAPSTTVSGSVAGPAKAEQPRREWRSPPRCEQAANSHTPPCPMPNSAPSFRLSWNPAWSGQTHHTSPASKIRLAEHPVLRATGRAPARRRERPEQQVAARRDRSVSVEDMVRCPCAVRAASVHVRAAVAADLHSGPDATRRRSRLPDGLLGDALPPLSRDAAHLMHTGV